MTLVEGRRDRWVRYPLLLWLGTVLLVIYAPMGLVLLFSLNSGRFLTFPLESFSLEWYQLLFADSTFVASLKNSLILSTSISLAATSLGFLGAYALVHSHFRGKTLLTQFLITPLAVPGILLGMALRVYCFRLGWQFSLFTAFLGHLLVALPLAVLLLRARIQQIPLSLEEAAWNLGAQRWRSLLEIVLPLCLPGLIASLLLTFTLSFDEFIIAYLLTQFEITLPIKIWTLLITGFDPTVNAIGSLVFLLSLSVALMAQLLLFKREKDTGGGG